MGNQASGYRGGGQDILGDSVGCLKLVEVKCVFKSENGRVRWYVVLVDGRGVCLVQSCMVDEGSFEEFWRIEMKSPFFRVSGCVSSGL